MSVDEIINNGYKYYNYNGNKVKSSYIQVDEMPSWGKINSWTLNIEKKIKELEEKITKQKEVCAESPGDIFVLKFLKNLPCMQSIMKV